MISKALKLGTLLFALAAITAAHADDERTACSGNDIGNLAETTKDLREDRYNRDLAIKTATTQSWDQEAVHQALILASQWNTFAVHTCRRVEAGREWSACRIDAVVKAYREFDQLCDDASENSRLLALRLREFVQ